ncbi:MAG: LCP family protein [Candidatus Portnoybacteria bacterium]|nr:LCP family protein [Candidatus Portnoybacteria bacterium]
MQDYQEQQYNNIPSGRQILIEEKPPKSRFKRFFLLIIFLIVICGGLAVFALKTGFTFSQININSIIGGGKLPVDQPIKERDPDRINILLLGMRGEGDPNGGLLSDSIILVSIQKSTGKVALISIPRDLYVVIPDTDQMAKINAAYAYGEERKYGGGGIIYSKAIVSEVTGLYIDYAVSVDHQAFREAIDAIGGIDIYLDKPFVEDKQFTDEIIINLPAGKNHLDGKTALFYVRSRYTTSDFDRMRRQQRVLMAMKNKILSIGVLANPVRVFNLLDILGRNVRTDMGVNEIQQMIGFASNADTSRIKTKIFDTTPEGFLYSAYAENGAYILLPRAGDYSQIRETCKNIFEKT